ncbi:unnamed protein product [Pedinophyceae sp. YPF-701]|nr:unnamed protein product [Pedinophyceae sp. YPF-701]
MDDIMDLDPDKCRLKGPGYTGGPAGARLNVDVTLNKADGSRLVCGHATVTARVMPARGGPDAPPAAEASTKDNHDGTFVCVYTAPPRGNYMLHVEVMGMPIAGTPAPLFIGPEDKSYKDYVEKGDVAARDKDADAGPEQLGAKQRTPPPQAASEAAQGGGPKEVFMGPGTAAGLVHARIFGMLVMNAQPEQVQELARDRNASAVFVIGDGVRQARTRHVEAFMSQVGPVLSVSDEKSDAGSLRVELASPLKAQQALALSGQELAMEGRRVVVRVVAAPPSGPSLALIQAIKAAESQGQQTAQEQAGAAPAAAGGDLMSRMAAIKAALLQQQAEAARAAERDGAAERSRRDSERDRERGRDRHRDRDRDEWAQSEPEPGASARAARRRQGGVFPTAARL